MKIKLAWNEAEVEGAVHERLPTASFDSSRPFDPPSTLSERPAKQTEEPRPLSRLQTKNKLDWHEAEVEETACASPPTASIGWAQDAPFGFPRHAVDDWPPP